MSNATEAIADTIQVESVLIDQLYRAFRPVLDWETFSECLDTLIRDGRVLKSGNLLTWNQQSEAAA